MNLELVPWWVWVAAGLSCGSAPIFRVLVIIGMWAMLRSWGAL